ncbi:MAG: imidazole glycerol phosphate synthase subunit HisH [Gammaproteobacteria bacterium]|nr:imidazole glycerol phosphate synthase subunit HisH [Gammaproteobacteria bacterium]MCY4255009.1 imidazole glycerol phosphate synthase subunit HisH [Gammaproteobacteria bacterium]
MTSNVALVDCGGANIASLRFALKRLGVEARFTREVAEIERADKVFLPGVGAAGTGMEKLREAGLEALIPRLEQPVLGICLGMQLLYDLSSEENTPCLGIIPGRVGLLPASPERTIPHMGWNQVVRRGESKLLEGIPNRAWFYFVHSYAAAPNADCIGETEHGRSFASVVRKNNFFGVQFHPERSGANGQRLLKNFLAISRPPLP